MFSTIPLKIGPSTCHITSNCWICLLWALYLRCDGICVQSPMIPRLVQLCFSNLHILKGKWLPFQMVYADSPSCTSESRDSPSNCMYLKSQNAKPHREISLLSPYDFREFWAYKVCTKATHIFLWNTILRRTVNLSKSVTIFTSLCV